uniref:C2H2-type domain-containing protein n=1 Tax=Glossina brevipalpis TaxID=37001 RepID=A0A1A9WZF4_9MUSC
MLANGDAAALVLLVLEMLFIDVMCTLCQKTSTELDEFLEHLQTNHYEPLIPREENFSLNCNKKEKDAEEITFGKEENISHYVSDKGEDSNSSLEYILKRETKMITSSNVQLPDKNEKTAVNSKPYKCEYCPARFVWKSSVRVHEKRHNVGKTVRKCKRGPYICSHCDKVLRSPGILNQHLHMHDGLKTYRCEQCQATFTWKSNLKTHQKIHEGERPFLCHFCSNSFLSAKQQRLHERSHTGERPYICEFCGKSFPFSSGLSSHRSSQHLKERNFICDKCDKRFNRRSQLRLHQINMHTEKPLNHVCTICKEAFKGKKPLKSHTKIHKEKNFKCVECNKIFARYSGFGKRQGYICPHCRKVFKRTWNLKQHLHIHDGLKPYKCEHCPASFAWKSGLRVHEKRHKGEKPFIWRKRGEYNCPHCYKVFKKSWDLKEHLHIHDGLKPYKCEHCPVSFACKSNLRAHEKRHDGERPFVCHFCSSSFPSAKQRRLHERSHTGERPFVCEFCGKSFPFSSGLRSHRSSQHLKERNFVCGKCDKRFNRRSQLRLHHKNMHTEKPRTHVCTICNAAFKDVYVLKGHLTIHREKTYKCLECDKKFANNSGLYSHRKRHEKQRDRFLKEGMRTAKYLLNNYGHESWPMKNEKKTFNSSKTPENLNHT